MQEEEGEGARHSCRGHSQRKGPDAGMQSVCMKNGEKEAGRRVAGGGV